MDKDNFGINKLMPQTSQPQRFGPLKSAQQFEAICGAVRKGLSLAG